MAVIDEVVDGIGGLLTRVLQLRQNVDRGHFLWFRGASSQNHQLIPKIMRDGKTIDDVFEREKRLLTRFRQRSLAYWPAGYPQNNWEHMFAMQHYGMPTRLLDWSENLFVAAYFALSKIPPLDARANEGQEGEVVENLPVVWCVDPVAWNRSAQNLREYGDSVHVLTTADEDAESYRPETQKRRNRTPVAIFGTHNSQRIVAQRGTFFVWGGEVNPLEDFAAAANGGSIWKLRVRGDRRELADSLTFLGFSETMVFPELPSLAEELSRAESWRG